MYAVVQYYYKRQCKKPCHFHILHRMLSYKIHLVHIFLMNNVDNYVYICDSQRYVQVVTVVRQYK